MLFCALKDHLPINHWTKYTDFTEYSQYLVAQNINTTMSLGWQLVIKSRKADVNTMYKWDTSKNNKISLMKPHLIMLLQEHGHKLDLPEYIFGSKDTELLLQYVACS